MRLYPLTTHTAFDADLTIFAAASLKEALDEASVSYMRQYGDKVKISFGPSSALARQIVSGKKLENPLPHPARKPADETS